ncbi:MAG: CDP-alcohol phosphatidyltransferase [Bacteroidales bacterium]|jgi:phosphatidylglycerophosphate synthase|nr:CDP-alcohol phosphatidyltransferase [Bacteroidales bacterium]
MKDKNDALAKIATDRQRTNLLKKYEQNLIAFLVVRIPKFISSNTLTAIGLCGSIVTALGFILAKYVHPALLLLGIVGFAVNWFGDSLDGRLAYYRNKPRKWYGFSLDFVVDWLTIILIGLGYIVYVGGEWELLGFCFVVLYGWSMMMALLKYKITNKYEIDSGLFSPTEVRIVLCLILAAEVIWQGSIIFSSAFACVFLCIVNIIDFLKLLKSADQRDKDDKQATKQD